MRIAFWRKAIPTEPDEVNPEQYAERDEGDPYEELGATLLADMAAQGFKIAIDADCPGCGWGERNFDPATHLFGCSRCEFTSYGRDGDDEPGPMARAQDLWEQYKHEMTKENTPAAFMNDEYTYADDVWMSEAGRSEEIEKELLALVRAHPDVFAGTWFADMLQEADEAASTTIHVDEDGEPTTDEGCGCTDEHRCDTATAAAQAVEALDALGFDVDDARAQARAREAGITTTWVAIDDLPDWTGMRTTVVEHREHSNGDRVVIEHPERQHEAPIPSLQLCAMWAQAVGDDAQAAVLCATAAEAQARALSAYAKARAGIVPVATATGALSAAWECAADVAQYFGETLPDQHVDVQRAAGFRV